MVSFFPFKFKDKIKVKIKTQIIDRKYFWKSCFIINKKNTKLTKIQTTGDVSIKLKNTNNNIPKKLPTKFKL